MKKDNAVLAAKITAKTSLPAYAVVTAVEKMELIARRVNADSVSYANGTLDSARLERRLGLYRKRLHEVCEDLGLSGYSFGLGGDPRGYCVKFRMDGIGGNTLGGDAEGWGIDF